MSCKIRRKEFRSFHVAVGNNAKYIERISISDFTCYTSAVLCCRACSMKCVSYFICWLFQRGFYEPAMNDAAEKLKKNFCFLPPVTFARFSPH